jgi:hypothetical protein
VNIRIFLSFVASNQRTLTPAVRWYFFCRWDRLRIRGHVCVSSVVGSLLLLLTLTHRHQGNRAAAEDEQRGRRRYGLSTRRRTLRRGGRNAVPLLPTANMGAGRAIFTTTAGTTTDDDSPSSSSSSYEDDDADIRLRRPARPRGRSEARSGPTVK